MLDPDRVADASPRIIEYISTKRSEEEGLHGGPRKGANEPENYAAILSTLPGLHD